MSKVEHLYTFNRKKIKVRMAELDLNFQTLAERVSELSNRKVGLSYMNHIILGRRSGKHLLPFIAEALRLPVRKMVIKPTRQPKPEEQEAA